MWKLARRVYLSGGLVFGVSFAAMGQSMVYPDLTQTLETAQNLAGEKQFSLALATLEASNPADKDEYEYRFLRARILTWSGNYVAAGQAYDSLLKEFPNNYDVMVSFGYLEFFRGNLSSAESQFNKVIAANPGYLDAYEGLRRTYDLRNSTRSVSYTPLAQAISCKPGEVLTRDGACTAP